MKLTKKDVGKTFYAVGTGNNRSNEPVRVVITKVGRVNVSFIKEGHSFEHTGHMDGDHISTGLNSGYSLYVSLDAYRNEQRRFDAIQYITRLDGRDITGDVEQAATLLGWKSSDQ